MNRLSRYCDGFMEAAWLAVIFVTPVFFNIDSSVTFEGPKIMLLRAMVLAALAAWGVKLISDGGLRFERVVRPTSAGQFLRMPLVLPVLLLLVSYFLSTLFSLSPASSLNGSLYRSESLYTWLSYVLLFVVVAANLRRRDQLERLLVLLAAASFVVDIFAILQKFGLDPHILQIWNVDVLTRVASTVGHPIFTGAFLGMSVFVLLGRALLAFQSAWARRVTLVGDLIRAVIYTVISILNLLALWYTGSRGPLLGAFAGLAIFVMLLLLYWRMHRVLSVVFVLGVLAAVFLVLLNIPNGPLENLRQSRLIGPLGRVFELQGGTGRMRVLMWTGMSQVMSPHSPLTIPEEPSQSGRPDRWNVLRPLIGYGPEAVRLIYEGYYDPEMYITESRTVTFDRSHNGFWDAWGFFGLLGVFAEFGFFLSLSYYSLKWLGLLAQPFARKLYWGLSLGAGLLTTLGLAFMSQTPYLGLGVPLALLVGPVGILVYRVIHPVTETEPQPESWRAVTLISFFAAVISHHVEMLSGIGVVATSSLFWVFGALTVVIGLFPLSVDEIAPVEAATKNALRSRSMAKSSKDERVWAKDLRRVGANIGALTLVMLTLGAVFIVVPQAASSVSGTLANSLTSLSGSKGPTSYGMLGLFFGALLLTGLLLQLETDALFGRKPGWSDLLTAVGLGLLVSTVLWLIRASQLVTIKQAQDAGDIAVFSTGIVGLLTGYCGMLLLLFLVWAVALSPEGKRPVRAVRQNLASMTGYVLLLAAGLVLIVSTNLLSMQADIYFSLAKNIIDPSQKQTIQAMYERALEMAPNQYEYFLFAGENFYRFAVSEADPANKENWTKLAFEKLQRAYQLNPFVVDNMIALARTYRLWGESTQDSAFKASRFSQAEAYYQQAMKIKGGRIDYLLDWADFSISKGEFAAAQKQIGVALAVDGSYDVSYALLGKSYLAQAGTEQDAALRAELLNKAVLAFQKQAELLTQQGGNPAFALINLGNAYQSLQEYEEARATYLRAVEAGAGEYQWKVFVEMAKLSGKLNDLAGLRGYLQKAVESAPAAEKPALQSKLDSLAP